MKRWLMEPEHISRYIVWLLSGIIAGILIAGSLNTDNLSVQAMLYCAAVMLFVACLRRYRVGLILVLLSGVMLGIARGSIDDQTTAPYQQYIGKQVVLTGTVSEDPSVGIKGETRLRLNEVMINAQPVGGQVWVSLEDAEKTVERSDTLVVSGLLVEGFGNVSASMYRAQIDTLIKSSKQDMGLQARNVFAESTAKSLDEPNLSLGLGYLLGLKSALPEDLAAQVQLLGLTHVVVASGYNLTILVGFARRIFERISKYLAALTGGGMIIAFMAITGLSPSMTRAGLVAGLSLTAWYYGRKIHPVSLLIIAAAGTLLYKPSYIWGDIGWYLSFAAFFGILVIAPLVHHYFWGDETRPSMLRELLVATASAQVATLPIVLAVFGSFSLFALPANALILPIVPLAMLATFVAGAVGFLSTGLAAIFAWPAEFLLSYCVTTIDFMAKLPNAQTDVTIQSAHVALGYIFIGILILFMQRATKHSFINDKTIIE